jgi:hypothetical protein
MDTHTQSHTMQGETAALMATTTKTTAAAAAAHIQHCNDVM